MKKLILILFIVILSNYDCFGNNRIFKPLGGEKVEYTDQLTISWEADSIITSVNIKKWDSNSKQWEYIALNRYPFNTYSWEIPDSLNGTNCLIKLEFLKNGKVYSGDISSAYFAIIAPVEIPIKSEITDKSGNLSNILLYPNPIHNILNLKGLGDNTKQIRIKDINGKNFKTISDTKEDELSVNISDCTPGIYFVEIENTGGKSYFYKFIKE